MKSLFLFFLFISVFVSCNTKQTLNITVEDIDEYVSSVQDTSNEYVLQIGLRFSKDDSIYQVRSYSEGDTVVMFVEEIETSEYFTIRNSIYKEGLPVYVEEYITDFSKEEDDLLKRAIYLNGAVVLKAYEGIVRYDDMGDEITEMQECKVDMNNYNFDRPYDAIAQKGDFEMKFGEFLNIDPQIYLILENKNSGYNVALYLVQADMLIENLMNFPKEYEGKTIQVFHEFVMMNGVERMIYRGGIVKD